MSRTTRCLEKYSVPESGKPILCGHVFAQLNCGISLKEVHGWACGHNAKNNFPEIDYYYFRRKKKIYSSRNIGARHFLIFEQTCGEVMKFRAPTTSPEAPQTYHDMYTYFKNSCETKPKNFTTAKKNLKEWFN